MNELTTEQQTEINNLVAVVPQQVIIRSKEGYTNAATQLVVLSQNLRRLEDVRKSITGPMSTAITRINSFFGAPRLRLEGAINEIKAGMGSYLQEEKVKAAAAQKLIDDAARAEQRRIQELADQAKERATKELAAAREREAKAVAAGRLKDAAKAAEAATRIEVNQAIRSDMATAKIQALENVPSGVVAPSVAGVTTAKRWVFEIINPAAVPRQFTMPDEKKIRAAITAGARYMDGVRIYEEESVVISSRKVS